MSHCLHLIRQSAPPGQQQGGAHRSGGAARTRLFTETLRDCKPSPLAPPGPAGPDWVLRHGTQLLEVLKANRKGGQSDGEVEKEGV